MPVVNIRKESCDVYIGRKSKTDPGKWGNPFVVGVDGTLEEVIKKYEMYLLERVAKSEITVYDLAKLHTCRIGCFCKPKPCHGDILEKYAKMAYELLDKKGKL